MRSKRGKQVLAFMIATSLFLVIFTSVSKSSMQLKPLHDQPQTSIVRNSNQVLSNPTFKNIEAQQNLYTPVMPLDLNDKISPIIEHVPIQTITSITPVILKARIHDNNSLPTAKLFYKKDKDGKFASITMNSSPLDPEEFTAEIPEMDVNQRIIYYLEASDGINTKKSVEYTITVSKAEVDYSKVPMFLVTEIVADSSPILDLDGYEFVEVYNNTDKDINFKDYKILYRFGAEATTDVIWPSTPDNIVIKSRATLVFWMINDTNKDKTVADFNEHYHTDLVENKTIVRVNNANMANIGMHGIVVADNTKKEITVSYYNDQTDKDDTKANRGIVFKYPIDGSTVSSKMSSREVKGTPGRIKSGQVPKKVIKIEEDQSKPILNKIPTKSSVKETEDLTVSVDAKDDKAVRTVKVFYKSNESTYKSEILKRDYTTQLFSFKIPSIEMMGKDFVEYYFVASDGTNETRSKTYHVKVETERNRKSLRLNMKEKQILAGKVMIKGTSNDESSDNVKIYIDDKDVTANSTKSLENNAYLAFEVSGVNYFFQNAVTIGNEVLHIFDDFIVDWQTISIPIEPDRLKSGDNVFTIRAGNKATPFDLKSVENRDDFQVRNVRLVLGDGTVLKNTASSDPAMVININERTPFNDFHFTITKKNTSSKAYMWETKAISDGKYSITVKDSNEELVVPVVVDNTAPDIDASIKKEKVYKGKFVIAPVITDMISGIALTEVTLDGNKITIPYRTASSQLTPGSHVLHIKATDQAGNTNEIDVPFSVVHENPDKPEVENKEVSSLRVKVTDPTNDEMDVTFYKAFKYKPSESNSIQTYQNTANMEPPLTPEPLGEGSLDYKELELMSNEDGRYVTKDSNDQFPYHRFVVTLDRLVKETDQVEVIWKGKSLEGRKVTMYAWSYKDNIWKDITHQIAGKDDFTLKGNVAVSEYVKNLKINVMIQDEIPASANDYDYTFVWMSDTQYYSKLYPYIFDSQTQWIAQNKDAMKIQYVVHTGDLVEQSDQEIQWKNADQYMQTLENANIPYGVLAGNHDVDHKTSDYTQFSKYFGADRFQKNPYYGGTYKNNRGHYDLISAGGNDFIMVYLGWGVDKEGISWMNQVLAKYPDRKAIVNFHEYLMASGTRHPNGEILYKEVVLKNPNVIAVLSGHYHESQMILDEIDDNLDGKPDRKVYQLLADYQAGPEGGQGYMRLLHFDQDNNRIIVNTYSPYKNDYNFFNPDTFPGKDEFVMNVDLQPMKKRVSTDFFEVNVYTNSVIGQVDNVKSGEFAEVKWNGLREHKTHYWYAVARDRYTGKTVSDIWTYKVRK